MLAAMTLSGGLSILTQPAISAALGMDGLTGHASSSTRGYDRGD